MIRTVITVEVGDTPASHVREAVHNLALSYQNNPNPHYFLVSRHGKLTTDVLFENEILNLVNTLCEVKDGQIQMRGGSQEVEIIRRSC